MTALPISMRSVIWPTSAIAVMASRYPGTCGIQNDAKPASSAARTVGDQAGQSITALPFLIGANHHT